CQSVGIPEIIIFSIDGFFDEYGIDGFQEFMTALLGFNHVGLVFNRRATFFGNLKGNENPTGSIFGFFFQDKWLDAWVGIVPGSWAIGLCIVPFITLFISPRKMPTEKERGDEDHEITKQRTPLSKLLVITRVALVSITVFMAIFAVVSLINLTIFNLDIVAIYL
nr:hypothetical protein [Candidatus Sigynarchaeota archaeon]